MSLKIKYTDIRHNMCYYCGEIDNVSKVVLRGFIPFHPSCLEESKDYRVKLDLIFNLLDIYQLYDNEFFIHRDLLKSEFNNERINAYKVIVQGNRFNVYVLTDQMFYRYSAEVSGQRWNEERTSFTKSDYIIFTSLIAWS